MCRLADKLSDLDQEPETTAPKQCLAVRRAERGVKNRRAPKAHRAVHPSPELSAGGGKEKCPFGRQAVHGARARAAREGRESLTLASFYRPFDPLDNGPPERTFGLTVCKAHAHRIRFPHN